VEEELVLGEIAGQDHRVGIGATRV